MPTTNSDPAWCDVIGRGRMGNAMASALSAAGVAVRGPFERGATGGGAAIVLLCVPDREIGAASAAVERGPIVGHLSASSSLALLEPHERFLLHPLLSVVGERASFNGATCAVEWSSDDARDVAFALATRLGMRARVIAAGQRALYHAAASAASNYVTTTLGLAERLAEHVGIDRSALLPLVQSAVDHWAAHGAAHALTGPIARGDEATVSAQRDAVEQEAPELLRVWDDLVQATRDLAATKRETA